MKYTHKTMGALARKQNVTSASTRGCSSSETRRQTKKQYDVQHTTVHAARLARRRAQDAKQRDANTALRVSSRALSAGHLKLFFVA